MRRAMDLSQRGLGFVNPNPLVGAVIVKEGKIIGEGYHQKYGEDHAEILAINNARNSCRGATLFVTLEPCNHRGKTPPCTDRIIQEKFARVVIGLLDPNPNVPGGGAQRLRDSGIEVSTGILKDEIARANEVFIKFIKSRVPFCALKTAMTLDGKIATYTGDSRWISNELSRKQAHRLRHHYAAIMVGVNTVVKDDPELTDRSEFTEKSHPERIIVDSNARTPVNAKVLDTNVAPTLIAVTDKAPESNIKVLQKKGIEIVRCPEREGKVDIGYLIRHLGQRNIDSVLLEGGSRLNFSALQQGIIDKVYSFISPKMIGGEKAITPVGGDGFERIDDAITLNIDRIRRFEEDVYIESYITENHHVYRDH